MKLFKQFSGQHEKSGWLPLVKRVIFFLTIYTMVSMWQILPMQNQVLFRFQNIPLPDSITFPLTGEQFFTRAGGHLKDGYRQKMLASHANMLDFGAKRLLLLEFAKEVKFYGYTEENLFCSIALCQWCRYKAEQVLPSLLLDVAQKADGILAGAMITSVDVRDQASRWASCSLLRNKDGQVAVRIHFNWRTLLLPIALARHLCWHELCHISQPNHGAEFRKLLASYSPGASGHEKALNIAWRSMPAWAMSTLMARGILKISPRRKLKTQSLF